MHCAIAFSVSGNIEPNNIIAVKPDAISIFGSVNNMAVADTPIPNTK